MSEHTEMSSATTALPAACSAAAQRMRAHRQRRREGLRCIVVQLRETEIDELMKYRTRLPIHRRQEDDLSIPAFLRRT
jgi:hypothetical protein